jgi:hypothetical protein
MKHLALLALLDFSLSFTVNPLIMWRSLDVYIEGRQWKRYLREPRSIGKNNDLL